MPPKRRHRIHAHQGTPVRSKVRPAVRPVQPIAPVQTQSISLNNSPVSVPSLAQRIQEGRLQNPSPKTKRKTQKSLLNVRIGTPLNGPLKPRAITQRVVAPLGSRLNGPQVNRPKVNATNKFANFKRRVQEGRALEPKKSTAMKTHKEEVLKRIFDAAKSTKPKRVPETLEEAQKRLNAELNKNIKENSLYGPIFNKQRDDNADKELTSALGKASRMAELTNKHYGRIQKRRIDPAQQRKK